MSEKPKLKLVPWNPAWVGHSKLDLHAIYRRPRWVEDEYGEKQREYNGDGVATWDLTGGLPVRQHVAWAAKGYEYVTLADKASLVDAGRYGTVMAADQETGELKPTSDWKQYDQHITGGPWNYKKYAQGQSATTTLEAEQLRADVEEYGSVAVQALRRRYQPDFTLPLQLQNIPPRAAVAPVVEKFVEKVEEERAGKRMTRGPVGVSE